MCETEEGKHTKESKSLDQEILKNSQLLLAMCLSLPVSDPQTV